MPLISIRELTKIYEMGTTIVRALDQVSLDIEAGEFVAITGASGSGKSTMMHLLGCLDRPTSGRYVLNDQDVSAMDDAELARIRNRHIGFVFQTFNLIPRVTAVEQVSLPLFYARKINTQAAARRALERVGLGARASHRPSELSGGERQRVAIARAIVNDPVLVLADEPTGNLDTRTGKQIMQVFHALNAQGVTIVLVTHEADIAMQARRVVQMRDGKVIRDESTERIRSEHRRPIDMEGGEGPESHEGEGARFEHSAAGGGVEVAAPVQTRPVQTEPETQPQGAESLTEFELPVRLRPGTTAIRNLGAVSAIGGLLVMVAYLSAKETFWGSGGVQAASNTVVIGFQLLGVIAFIGGIVVARSKPKELARWYGFGRLAVGMLLGIAGILAPPAARAIEGAFRSAPAVESAEGADSEAGRADGASSGASGSREAGNATDPDGEAGGA